VSPFTRAVPGPDALKIARCIQRAVETVVTRTSSRPDIVSILLDIALRIIEGDQHGRLWHEVDDG
jgi:hypothetical protein